MRKKTIILLALLLPCLVHAQHTGWLTRTLALQIGTDIGGALPTNLKYIPSTFRAYPKLAVSIGAKGNMRVAEHWLMGMEATYKTVAMDADAYVENQLAFVPDNVNGTLTYKKQYYSGQAKMSMSFTQLEIPLYFTYAFGSTGINKMHMGGYGAWVMNSRFRTDPQKGYIGSMRDQIDVPVDIPTAEVTMDFTDVMAKWDAGVLLGYEREIFSRINLGFRLTVGFKDIFKKDVYPDDPEVKKVLAYNMTHVRGSFVVSYDLFSINGWLVNRKNKEQ